MYFKQVPPLPSQIHRVLWQREQIGTVSFTASHLERQDCNDGACNWDGVINFEPVVGRVSLCTRSGGIHSKCTRYNYCCIIMQGFACYIILYIEPSLEQTGITSHVFSYPFSDRLPMRSRSPLQFFVKQREMIEEGVSNRRQ